MNNPLTLMHFYLHEKLKMKNMSKKEKMALEDFSNHIEHYLETSLDIVKQLYFNEILKNKAEEKYFINEFINFITNYDSNNKIPEEEIPEDEIIWID